jgi:hypothetical protein
MQQAAPEEEKEATCASAIQNLLTDTSFADVELQGTDDNGETIPVHKLILAYRSKFFKTLFYENFAESSRRVVKLGYKGEIL